MLAHVVAENEPVHVDELAESIFLAHSRRGG